MIDSSSLVDGLSALGGFYAVTKHRANEAEKNRVHDERLYHLKVSKINQENTQLARSDKTKTTKIIRIMLMVLVLGVFVTLGMAAFFNIPVSMPIAHKYSFLFVSWSKTEVVKMQGLVYLPWIQQLTFLIAGSSYGAIV